VGKHVYQSNIEYKSSKVTLEASLEGGEREAADMLKSCKEGTRVAGLKRRRAKR